MVLFEALDLARYRLHALKRDLKGAVVRYSCTQRGRLLLLALRLENPLSSDAQRPRLS